MEKSDRVRIPKPVTTGGTIGIIGTSGPSNPTLFAPAVHTLKSLGFRVKIALDPTLYYGKTDYLFASDSGERRAAALHALFADPEVECIISSRGSYGALELLPHLKFDEIAKHPKPFVGFSDTTILLVALAERSGVPAIHGPSVEATFGKYAKSEEAKASVASLLDLVQRNSLSAFDAVAKSYLFASGEMRGPVTGGNLMSLVSLLGTPYEPLLDDHILFLEEVREKPYKVHRALQQLKLAGKLARLCGVILGDFVDCVHDKGLGPDLDMVLRDVFRNVSYPVIRLAGLGHGPINLALPFGRTMVIDANRLEFSTSTGL